MNEESFICSFFPSLFNVNIIIIPIKSLSLLYKAVTNQKMLKHRWATQYSRRRKQKGTFSEVNKYHNENRLFNVLFRFLSLFVVIMVITLLVFFCVCNLLIRGILNSNLNYSEAISSLSLFSFLLIEN
jgi:uncharacterized BrkB/YihY/UPF0761 family membrane protein